MALSANKICPMGDVIPGHANRGNPYITMVPVAEYKQTNDGPRTEEAK
jgi:hypothetical protein